MARLLNISFLMFTSMTGPFLRATVLVMITAAAPLMGATGDDSVRVTFGHTLSDFTGTVPFGPARVAVDPASNEVLVGWGREVRVFNEVGMQVHKFGTSIKQAGILDLVAAPSGDLFTAAVDLESHGGRPRVVITRRDFRGVPTEEITLVGLTGRFETLLPNRFFQHDGRLILVDTSRWLAVTVEFDGRFVKGLDLVSILEFEIEELESLHIAGVTVDSHGNILLTCSTLFQAWAISPDGEVLASWGKSGSAPGTFGVIAGIARDRHDRTFVADKNRGVVLVFDPEFRFVTEFGGDPRKPGLLGLPSNVVTDDDGHIFVTQIGRQGVLVYDIRPK